MSLKVMLAIETLSTHLASYGDLFTVPDDKISRLRRFIGRGASLYVGKSFFVDGELSKDLMHKCMFGDCACDLEHVVIFASIYGSFKLEKIFGSREIDFDITDDVIIVVCRNGVRTHGSCHNRRHYNRGPGKKFNWAPDISENGLFDFLEFKVLCFNDLLHTCERKSLHNVFVSYYAY